MPLRPNSELESLCDKFGTDKESRRDAPRPYDWEPHTYAEWYDLHFGPKRFDIRSLLEVGIGTNRTDVLGNMGVNGVPGASLRMWRDFFPRASIYGADIDHRILFSENRILTGQMDQTDPESVAAFLSTLGLRDLDVIIDDGLHEFTANVTTFECLFPSLAAGGTYVVEDVKVRDALQWQNFLGGRYTGAVCSLLHRNRSDLLDNSLVIVTKR